MKQKTKLVEKQVDYLKNGQPRFVSIVDHGANQTPFAVLKSIKGEKTMPKSTTTKTKKRLRLVRKGEKLAGVRKLTFAKEYFATDELVSKYLEDNNWDGYSIVENATHFEAANEDVTDKEFKSLRRVKVVNGVEAFVGEATSKAAENADIEDEGAEEAAKAEEEAEEEAVEAETEIAAAEEAGTEVKSVERVCKFDYWGAYMSGENSLEGVMKDGMKDGVPPGFDEIMISMSVAVSNTLTSSAENSSKKALLDTIGTEFADVVYNVYEVFNKTMELESKSDNQQAFLDNTQKFIDTNKSVVETKSVGETTTDDVNALMIKTISELATTVAKLTAKIDGVDEIASKAVEVASKAANDVETFSKKSPTKKAAGVDAVDDVLSAVEIKRAEKEAADIKAYQKRLHEDEMGIGYCMATSH